MLYKAIKERPILFSAPMVRAILDGRKTMTRRIIKSLVGATGVAGVYHRPDGRFIGTHLPVNGVGVTLPFVCPYGKPGDRLWVREAFAILDTDEGNCVFWRADEDTGDHPWKPSIHMPRWASRILLEITDVRVERLQDISEEDALSEGFVRLNASGRVTTEKGAQYAGVVWNTARAAFHELWDSINGPDSWNANPWVWAISFRRVQPCA